MSRAGMKRMFVASVAIVALSFCAAQANAGWWWGAGPSYCGGCCGCVPYSGCTSEWSGCCCQHRSYSCGCGCALSWCGFGWGRGCALGSGCGCGSGCGFGCGGGGCGCGGGCGWSCNSCFGPATYAGTVVATTGDPVGSACGCGMVVTPAAAPAYSVTPAAPAPTPALPTPAVPPAKSGMAPATPLVPVPPLDKPATPSLGVPPVTPPVPEGGGIIPDVPKRTSVEPTPANSGILTIWVPNEAKVTINGLLTKSTGSKRHFVSYGLTPGSTYKYVVKAEIVREGKIVAEEQTVSLTAGEQGGLAFGFNIPSSEGLAQSSPSSESLVQTK